MSKVIDLTCESWLIHKPSRKALDIRKAHPKFWSLPDAIAEREERIRILRRSNGKCNLEIARMLSEAEKNKPAKVGCCPVLARRFQIWFCSRTMAVAEKQKCEGKRYTLLDLADAVEENKLGTISWAKLHARLRRRFERYLGADVIAYGMGEVEFDQARQMWQPHHHVTIHGASDDRLKALRLKYYRAERTGPRPMVKSKPMPLPGWLSYNSKLVAFDKVPGIGPSSRGRLGDRASRQHFRYLSRRNPTSFVFAKGCWIVKSSN
jgi:hypothetical protein